MSTLTGKTALVTGASKGIGAGIAEALGRAGAHVAVNYASSREGAEAVVARIENAGGRAFAVGATLGKSQEVERLFAEASETLGTIDILVNNAGIYVPGPLEEANEEVFYRQFDTNVLGLLLATKAFAAQAKSGGSIVNISSVVTRLTPPGLGIYAATKSAVDALTKTHAKELGPRGIRVNSLSPGLVTTEGTTAAGFAGTDAERGMVAQTPLGRVGKPDDIADVALFLASDAARWITGENIPVSGGF